MANSNTCIGRGMQDPVTLLSLLIICFVLLIVLLIFRRRYFEQLQIEKVLQREIQDKEKEFSQLQIENNTLFIEQKQIPQMEVRIKQLHNKFDALQQNSTELKSIVAASHERNKIIPKLESQLMEKEIVIRSQNSKLAGQQAQLAAQQNQLETQKQHNKERVEELMTARRQLSEQFENIANRIFDEKTQKFGEVNKSSMDEILGPVKEQLGDFRKRVDEIHTHDIQARAGLTEHLAQLHSLNKEMNVEARNLTRALTGDNKAQGNWGEMVLEKVLEQSGLRKGQEYETQGCFRDNENRLLRPDVVIHLPENKDIVVDSKVSLIAYNRYINAADDEDKSLALKEHIHAIRKHINDLGTKDYADLKGLHSLDFVLMFLPIESAFMIAFQQDEKLFNDAFEKKIVVVTPTTLLATLRTIENTWRYERQNENAKKIADKAGSLYDKLRGFVEDFEKVGSQINSVHDTYFNARNKLTQGKGNIIKQAQDFIDLGVKIKKELPKSVTDCN